MSTPETPRGLALGLLLALPLAVQFGFVALAASLASQFFTMPTGTTSFYNLPQATILFTAYVVFAGTIWFVARRVGPPREVLAVRRTPLGRAIGLSVVALVVGVGASALLDPIFHGSASQKVELGPFPGTPASVIAIVLSAITIIGGAALTEELYFRGLLYGQLGRRWGAASAVVGSAGIFGLAHFEPNAFPSLFALGLVLGFLRLKTNSFWPGVGVHAANNVLAFTALLLALK
ncbi:MAG: CPBP family intramembrane glutamic endopeptidase [Thermoleophilia bacterium]